MDEYLRFSHQSRENFKVLWFIAYCHCKLCYYGVYTASYWL